MNRLSRHAGLKFLLILILSSAGTTFAQDMVKFNGYAIDVKGQEPAVPKNLEPKGEGRYGKWIVQFTGPIIEEQKKHLTALGCRIGDYLPDFAFIVTMDNKTKKHVESLPFINGVVRYKPAYKIDRRLKNEQGEIKLIKQDITRLRIRVDGTNNISILLAEVLKKNGKVMHVGTDVAEIEIQSGAIAHLAQIEEVLWIEEAADLRIMNDASTWVVQSNVVNEKKIWSKGLYGEGQIIGIADTGLDYDMPWFRDPLGTTIGPEHRKVIGYNTTYGDDYDADDPGHGTHVAGTLAGDRTPVDGLSTANGMAPKSRIYVQDITPGADFRVYPPTDLGELFLDSYNAGARIHTNSWGSADNYYTTHSLTADRFIWEHKDFLALFSSGNAGPATNTIGSPATAKNIISVGASLNGTSADNMASFSSNGPTADGRIKPTVTAPGDGVAEGSGVISADSDGVKNTNNSGTMPMRGASTATPAVAGAAALVRQYFMEGYYPSGVSSPDDVFTPSAALIKAVIINSAENMSGSYTDGSIPSTGQGWGRVNLSNALLFQGDTRLLSVVDNKIGLTTGQTWSQAYYSSADQPLKVTLVWTDFPGSEGAARALVNDLDLIVTAPDGTTTYFGNVFTNGESIPGGSADRLNVEEQVLIKNPVIGTYTITVSAYNIPYGPQPFAVVVTGASSVTSRGSISFSKPSYSGSSSAIIRVTDRDLNTDSSIVDDVMVRVFSTSEPAGENVRLFETGPDTAVFTGAVSLSTGGPVPGNGVVEVSDADVLTAEYQDADAGSGAPATVTATALIDTVVPIISNITMSDITDSNATVSWVTSEKADATVNYGATTALGASQSDPFFKTQHSITLSNLKESSTYYYEVRSNDSAGNLSIDNNGGALYSFTTIGVPPSLTVYSSNGSETYLGDTIIFGKVSDPSGVESVKINGNPPRTYRDKDGYYEGVVNLSDGENLVTVTATDTLGNERSLTMTIIRLLPPDLVVSDIKVPESSPVGKKINITDTVSNIESGNAKSFSVGIYLSTDAEITIYDRLLKTRTVSALVAGDSSTGTTEVEIPSSLTPGTYYIGAIADPENVQYESDENNNASIGIQIALEWPDLVAVAGITEGQIVPTGGTVQIFNIVKNVAFTASASAFTLGFYLSMDQVITTEDIYLGSRQINGLGPANISSETTLLNIPRYIAGGQYYVGVIADIDKQIVESDEQNNTNCASNVLTITGPDLLMTEVSSPGSALTGGMITVRDTVSASETGGAAPGTYVGLYLSKDETITTSDIFIGYREVRQLDAGGTDSAETSVNIPVGIPGGVYYIGAIADVYNSVQESNEENNWMKGNQVTVIASDLSITELSGPATGNAGASIMVRNTVLAAPSGGAAGSFYLNIYLSTDTTIDSSDILLGTRYISGLAAGATSTDDTVFTVPANLPAGIYYFGAIADPSNSVAETDELNNVFTGNKLEIVKPDLKMVSVTGPAAASTGETITVTDTVQAAAAGAPVGSFVVSYYLSTDRTITTSDIRLGERHVIGLAPDESSTADTILTVPMNIPGRNYYIGAIADGTNAVIEFDEDNNIALGNQITITGPDITMTAVSADLQAVTGGQISVTTTVSASEAGGASDSFSVCIYLSTDNKITTSDILLGQRTVPGLAPGTSNTAQTTFTVPIDVAAGVFRIGAIADCFGNVYESDENNNDLAGNEVMIVGPDLVAASVSGPSAAVTGETITITDSVAASSTAGASAGFYVWLYISADKVITTTDTYLGSRYVAGLMPGELSAGSTLVTVPADLASGTYYIGAVVDPQNYIAEPNETNNAVWGTQITITKAYPDLIATSASGPAAANTEEQITIMSTIRNQGTANADSFWVTIYVSTDAVITSSDVWLADVYVTGIAPGDARTVSQTVSVPSALNTGTYYIGVIVDKWGQVAESNEDNNVFIGSPIAITKVYPDLTTLSAAGPSSANTEDQIAVTATVKNLGLGHADASLMGIYLSTDDVITTSDIWLGDAYSRALAPGEADTLTTAVTLPTTIATGTYYIGVIADRTGSILESNESNNAAAGNQIAVTRLYPDLVMTSVSGPTTAAPRSQITVGATVKNAGLNSAAGFYVGIYLSADQNVDTLDTFLGQVYVSDLGRGADQPVTLTVTLPNSRGSYYIGAIADRVNMVAESNEKNNSLAGNQIIISR